MKAFIYALNSWFPVWWISLLLVLTASLGAYFITQTKYLLRPGWPYARARLVVWFFFVVSLYTMDSYYVSVIRSNGVIPDLFKYYIGALSFWVRFFVMASTRIYLLIHVYLFIPAVSRGFTYASIAQYMGYGRAAY